VKAFYDLNYWPYVNAAKETKECLETIFFHSPKNMMKFKLNRAMPSFISLSSALLALALALFS